MKGAIPATIQKVETMSRHARIVVEPRRRLPRLSSPNSSHSMTSSVGFSSSKSRILRSGKTNCPSSRTSGSRTARNRQASGSGQCYSSTGRNTRRKTGPTSNCSTEDGWTALSTASKRSCCDLRTGHEGDPRSRPLRVPGSDAREERPDVHQGSSGFLCAL